MATRVPVLLFDDGELEDMREVLRDLGVAFGQVRGDATASEMDRAVSLIVATPARLGDGARRREGAGPTAQRIAVLPEGASAPREALRAGQFDYLVRRPVHPEAVRLLLLRCLYGGEERRREPRLPVGSEALIRVGGIPRRVALVDLSRSGCRLLGPAPIKVGAPLDVLLPPEPGAEGPLALVGRTVRTSLRRGPSGEDLFATVVTFLPPGPEASATLERVLARRERGPARCASAQAPSPAEGPHSGEGERRRGERAVYERTVADFGGEALRVLVGRDLSLGGMRIERFPGLEVGDRVRLALYGTPDEGPLTTGATVQRDAGRSGMALVFDPLRPRDRDRLAKLVGSLPSIESLCDGDAKAKGDVLGALLDP